MGPSSLLREEVYPVCSGPLIPLGRGGLQLLCSGPFIPLERGGLPSVQWALHPSWERRFTQCAVGPSSLLREEVYSYCAMGPPSLLRQEIYPVCSRPLLPPERGGLSSVQWALQPSWERRFTQCAMGPSSLLRKEAFTYYAVGPSSLLREEVYPVCNGPFIPLERGGLPSVQWAHPPSWERRFIPTVQWALRPSWDRRFT